MIEILRPCVVQAHRIAVDHGCGFVERKKIAAVSGAGFYLALPALIMGARSE